MSINFGVDYYPEHWPEERWETDARLMQEMGVQVVRMAEFSWHKLEPVEGTYDFEWLDRVIRLLAKHGIKTILGTPSAAPPAWMCNKYPDVMPVDRNGQRRYFGGRHHDCQSNPIYREKVTAIVTRMADHFGNNPDVIGWQPDNELGNSHLDVCFCDSCRKSFQKWLQKKYVNVGALNKAWGTPFWSQEYNSFEEVFAPLKTLTGENPSTMLDWKRFHSDLIVDFLTMQVNILREKCPNQFVTHNYMGFSNCVDYYKLSKPLDFVCQDQYPTGYWIDDGWASPSELAATLDVIRSYKNRSYWMMEQESGICGWEYMGRLPAPGQLPLWALQSIGHGADTVVFFRWRTCTFGTEEYWHGILPHNGVPGRTYNEYKELIHKMNPLMEQMKGAVPKSDVGIIFSFDQNWAFEIQPNARGLNYQNHVRSWYKAFYDRHMNVDFITERADFPQYKLIVAPLQYLMSPVLADSFTRYVEAGGHLVLTMRSGVKETDNRCFTKDALPGLLRKLAGAQILDYDALSQNECEVRFDGADCQTESSDHFEGAAGFDGSSCQKKSEVCLEGAAPAACHGRFWADVLTPDEGTEVLATYASEWYKGAAAVTAHNVGKGVCWYVGTEPDDAFMSALAGLFVDKAEIRSMGCAKKAGSGLHGMPATDVEFVSKEKDGVVWSFVLNHSAEPRTYEYAVDAGELVFGENAGTLAAYEVHIYRK
ncbi:MAG: beta-galactosidase [Treponema sp.]|nr:beta-galactosidase [Candidatus Treponema caballi]